MEKTHQCKVISHVLFDFYSKETEKIEKLKPICEECVNQKFIDNQNQQKIEDFLREGEKRIKEMKNFCSKKIKSVNLDEILDIKMSLDRLINLLFKLNQNILLYEDDIQVLQHLIQNALANKQDKPYFDVKNIVLLLSKLDQSPILASDREFKIMERFRNQFESEFIQSLQEVRRKYQECEKVLNLTTCSMDKMGESRQNSIMVNQIKANVKDVVQQTVIDFLMPIKSEVCLNMDQLKFSSELTQFTSSTIVLSHNNRVATQTKRGSNNKGQNEFVLLEPALSKKQKWRIKINNMATQIFIGVCSFTELKQQDFNYFYKSKYRFGFMISQYCNTSRSWNNQREEENDQIIEFSFETGDIVDIYFDSEAGQILFKKNDEQQYALIAEFKTYMYFDLYAACFLWDIKDQVQILDNQ